MTKTRAHHTPPATRREAPTRRDPSDAAAAAHVASVKFVVGIGSSAGGLEVLRTLLSGVPAASHMSFIVVQHLAPQHRSRLTEILRHVSHLEVCEVTDGQIPAPNLVYITPPNADIIMQDGRLRLCPPDIKPGPKPSVNRFFKSLADDVGENAIGIILSGTGSDGALGVRAIKAAGGITLCQSFDTAKYDGMPRAAKQTGAVDMQLPPEDIAKQLLQFNAMADSAQTLGHQWHAATENDPHRAILSILESETHVNFTQYKRSTLNRRIERRVVATRCKSLLEYLTYLRSHADETRALFQDILISVTSFFRDDTAFDDLARSVASRCQTKQHGDVLRAWVVGCATGEEAYSIAIVMSEAIERGSKRITAQIFATDLDEHAMAVARKATYTKESLSALDAALVKKYFEEVDADHVRVRAFLRDRIIFARHDATLDPPFLKLDLVSCRNVLIYFDTELQKTMFRTFHYALDTGGILFLGRSEATSTSADLFHLAEKSSKIFTRSEKKGRLPRSYSRHEVHRETALSHRDRATTSTLDLLNSLIAGFAPDSVLVDADLQVRHIYGNASRVLNLPAGELTHELSKLLPAEMGSEAIALLRRAQKVLKPVRGHQRYQVNLGDETTSVQLYMVPLAYEGQHEFLVCFSSAHESSREARTAAESHAHLSPAERCEVLERELAITREHLQTIVEEHETANEEMQALNEELQSSNEELQSTNEELETTNEELQSTNEELTTVNEEVNVKSVEMLALNQRLQAVQNAISFSLLIADRHGNLVDYNPSARALFRLSDADRGQKLLGLDLHLDSPDVKTVITQGFETGRDTKSQLKVGERSFDLRVHLFYDFNHQVDGAVICFVENTELTGALERSQLYETRLAAILDNTPAVVTMKDLGGAYTYVNNRFCEVLSSDASQLLGKTDEDLFGVEIGEVMRERDFEVLKRRLPLRCEQMMPVDGKQRFWASSKFPLLDETRRALSICSISVDITERATHEQHLELFKRAVSSATAGILILEHRGAVAAHGPQDYVTLFASGELITRTESDPESLVDLALSALLPRLLGNAHHHAPSLAAAFCDTATATRVVNAADIGAPEDWIEFKSTRVQLSANGKHYLLISLFDVTQHVMAQKTIQLQHDEMARFSKLASLGEIAAGLSHEINTPLNVINTKVDLLKRLASRDKLDQEKVLRASVDIGRMLTNIANVIGGLKAITGLESEELHPYDLPPLLAEAASLCDFKVQQFGVKLTTRFYNDEPVSVDCYPVQIVQIIVNLINNAVDAIADLKERWITIDVYDAPANRVSVRLTDSGKGIDPAVAEKVMTPFFTTKRAHKGTGLGLSLSRTIARRHGGDLILAQGTPQHVFYR